MTNTTTNSDLDFGVIISYSSSENMSQTASVCMHDMYIGGIGYAEKVYELIKTTINNAIDMISSCRCKTGCAACIGDHHLDKKVVIWGLKNLFEETPPPVDIKQPENEERKYIDKPFSFEDVVTKWDEIVKFISEHESKYSRFLTTIKSVRCFGTTLVLLVESEFVKQWVLNDEIYNSISNILTYYIDVPEEFIIDIDIDPNSGINTIRNDKIARRLSDLKNT